MLHFLYTKWKAFLQKRQQVRELAPQTFSTLTEEILELARMVEKIQPEKNNRVQLSQLQKELGHLQELLNKKEFSQLSHEKRQKLKTNLLFSKDQLLEAMRAAPPPTDRLQ